MKPLVKICGLTNAADARLALELGADFLGFIFAPSARRITPLAAASIVAELRAGGMRKDAKTVAVFVNESPERMEAILRETGIDIAQIHGDETPVGLRRVRFSLVSRTARLYRRLRSRTGCLEAGGRGSGSGTFPEVCLRPHPFRRGSAGRVRRLGRDDGFGPSPSPPSARLIWRGRTCSSQAAYGRRMSPRSSSPSSPTASTWVRAVESRPGAKSPERLAALFRELRKIDKDGLDAWKTTKTAKPARGPRKVRHPRQGSRSATSASSAAATYPKSSGPPSRNWKPHGRPPASTRNSFPNTKNSALPTSAARRPSTSPKT